MSVREPSGRTGVREHAWNIALLGVLCLAYFYGLGEFGASNWQEAQRVEVARDMQARGSWLVPTINGRPYLAKPPLMYWATMGVAELRGGRVELWDLRVVAGLAGMLGVIGTYVVGCGLLAEGRRGTGLDAPTRRRMPLDAWGRSAAMWGAVMLAGGVLYFRSSRIGEIDILLAPAVVIAIGAIARAWGVWRDEGRTAWGWVVVAGVGAAMAAFAKGPPGLLVVALGGYGGVVCASALEARAGWRGRAWGLGVGGVLGVAAGVAAMVMREEQSGVAASIVGAILIAGIVAVVSAGVVWALSGERRGAVLRALWGTQPIVALGIGAGALGLWGWMVRGRIGDLAGAMAANEAEDNLRVLVAESPWNNLQAAGYGVGLASIGAIAGVVWLVKDRPRIRPGWVFVLAWAGLTIAAMSLLGKGVGRYLTPAWPAIALLGGMFVATLVGDARRPRLTGSLIGLACVVLVVVQGWWYGDGRVRYRAEQTPRPLMRELATEHRVDMARLTTLDFRTPAVDYEAGVWVQPVGAIGMRTAIAGGEPWTIEELVADVRKGGARTVLLRRDGPDKERLRAAGLRVEELPTRRVFLISGYKEAVVGVRVSAP